MSEVSHGKIQNTSFRRETLDIRSQSSGKNLKHVFKNLKYLTFNEQESVNKFNINKKYNNLNKKVGKNREELSPELRITHCEEYNKNVKFG